MSETMFVKPAPGLRVRREENPKEIVPPEGTQVPRTAYYVRRLRDGSLVGATPVKPASRAAGAEAKQTKKESSP
jgi:hypothetical protein